jgi:hypothetical protein
MPVASGYGETMRPIPPLPPDAPLTQLRGFALDFAEGEKVFPYESVAGLWISRELPV